MRKLIVGIVLLLLSFTCFAEQQPVEIKIEVESNTPTTIIIEEKTKQEIDIDTYYLHTLYFTEVGEYVYKIYQKDNIDKTIYEINVWVYIENNQLVGTIFVEGSTDKYVKAEKISFNNVEETTIPETTPAEETQPVPTTTPEPTEPETEPVYTTDYPTPPDTGDNSNITLWIIMSGLSLVAIVLLIATYKKTGSSDDKKK